MCTAAQDLTPALRFDGRELIMASARLGGSRGQDLWAATRDSTDNPWSPLVNLGPTVNTATTESFPTLSPGRKRLYFSSDRPGGSGAVDLYVSTRTK